MVVLSGAQLTALRSHPGRMQFYLGVFNAPSFYCWCQVNNGSAARGDRTIPYDNATWGSNPAGGFYTAADVLPNVTLYAGASYYGDAGRVRVKSMDANNIYVAENEDIAWADDLWLLITIVHQPWARYPRVTAVDDVVTVYQDYDIAYTDQATACPPVPIMGPPVVGFLDGSPATFTAYFDGSASYGLDGATIASYSWTFPGGDPASSAAATPGNVHWHADGQYIVKLTVTDSNGKSSSGYRPVLIYSSRIPVIVGSYPYTEFEVNSLSGDESGWRASLTVREDATRLTPPYFRDDSQIMLFGEGKAGNGAALPIPGNDQNRAALLFTGYVIGETITRDPETSEVHFEVAGICDRMKLIEQFSDTLEVAASPGAWYEFDEGLTVDLATLFHLRWRSTILEITDVYPTGKTAKGVMRQDWQQGNLYDQCQQLLDAICAKAISDKQGSLYMRVDPQVLPSGAERNAVDSIFTLADTDWREEQTFERRKLSAVGLVDVAGVGYDGGTDPDTDVEPILSLAPGNTPMYEGSLIEKVDGLVLENQAQSNQLAGDILAWRNNEFPSISIPMAGAWTALDVAPPSWITWTLSMAATKRAIYWTSARFLIRSMDITCNNETGEATVDIAVEKETDGADGITGNYPPDEPEESDSPVPVEPPIPPIEPTPGPATSGSWRKHVLCATGFGPYYTDNFVEAGSDPAGVPTWTKQINGMGADVACLSLAFHPLTPESCHYVCTAANVYKRTSLTGAWSVILSEATARAGCGGGGATGAFHNIQTSVYYSDHIYALYSWGATPSGKLFLCKSTNQGGSWTYHQVRSLLYAPAIFVSHLQTADPNGLGQRFYVAAYGSISGVKRYRSDDCGETWTNVSNGNVQSYEQLCICHANNTIVFSHYHSGIEYVMISTDSGATFVAVPNQSWGAPPVVNSNTPGKHVFNSQFSVPGLVRVQGGDYMHKSLDYGVTWTRYLSAAGAIPLNTEVVPDAVDYLYLNRQGGGSLAKPHLVWASADECVTMVNKGGANCDIAGTGGGDSIPYDANVVDLTPIWTLE